MRKKICYLGVLAVVLASCATKEPLVPETPEVVPEAKADSVLLDFGAYVNRGIATKAGAVGMLTTNTDGTAKLTDSQIGFGVFAYYNNGELYNEMAKPDFMYNQHITYDGANWTYSPLRYWPNEFGSNAESEEVDRLTFFAYAPWAQVTPSTGVLISDYNETAAETDPSKSPTTGIIGMSRNTSLGAPLVKYSVNYTPGKGVDLCWGVAAENYDDAVAGATQPTITAGKTYQNVVKPTTEKRIKFDFKHALASLNVQIDADIDAVSPAHDEALHEFTRIYVRSVTFEGFTSKGALNLNSEYQDGANPTWFDLSGSGKLNSDPITIYDGRRDGKEGIETGEAKNESPSDLNPLIVQSKTYNLALINPNDLIYGYKSGESKMSSDLQPGVTNSAVNLFNNNSLEAPVYVIPIDDEEMKITIVYDVETADPTLAGYLSDGETKGVSVENAISQKITLSSGAPMKLVAGKKYTIKLHLGLTSVKFDAAVSEWEDGNEANTDLPYNTFMLSGTNKDIAAGSVAGPVQFVISGLTEGSTVSGDNGGSSDVDAPIFEGLSDTGKVTSSGMVLVKTNVSENTTGAPRDLTLTITETLPDASTKVSTITIKQGVDIPIGSNKAYTLASAASGTQDITISGLVVGSTVTLTPDAGLTASVTGGVDSSNKVTAADGTITIQAAVPVNATGDDLALNLTVDDGAKTSVITLNQPAVSYLVNTSENWPESISGTANTVRFKITGLTPNRPFEYNDSESKMIKDGSGVEENIPVGLFTNGTPTFDGLVSGKVPDSGEVTVIASFSNGASTYGRTFKLVFNEKGIDNSSVVKTTTTVSIHQLANE